MAPLRLILWPWPDATATTANRVYRQEALVEKSNKITAIPVLREVLKMSPLRSSPSLDGEIPTIRTSFLGDTPDTGAYASVMHWQCAVPHHLLEASTMITAIPTTRQHRTTPHLEESGMHDTVETRLWIEEHDWLYGILKSPANMAPTFRLPDLISACVSVVLAPPDGVHALFAYLGTQLVLRDPATTRRREAMWRPQYEMLQALQRSAANRHPNPKFQLDQLTTACVALCRAADASGPAILQQARRNTAERAHHGWDAPPG